MTEEIVTSREELDAERDRIAERKRVICRYAVSSAVAVVFFFGIAYLMGLFTNVGNLTGNGLVAWMFGKIADALFVDAAFFLGAAGLLFCSRLGAYDTIAFGMRQAFGVIFKSPERLKYKNLYEYKQEKEKCRPEFRYLLWIGLTLLALALIALAVNVGLVDG